MIYLKKKGWAYSVLIVLMLIFSFVSTNNFVQSADISAPTVQWSKTYNGASASTVIKTVDDGYLMVSSPLISSQDTVLELIKTDSEGNQQWLQTYPGFPSNVLAVQATDEGYVIAGTTSQNPTRFFFAKIDALGAVLWNSTYGNDYFSSVTHLIGTRDGGYAILGQSMNYDSSDYRAVLVKINSQGRLEWNQTYGGSQTFYPCGLSQASDGGYILAASTSYFSFSVWLIKTDANGNTQWFRPFQSKNAEGDIIQIYGVQAFATVDGGYFLLTRTSEYQASISSDVSATLAFKTDSNGDQQWSRTYPYVYHTAFQTSDGGYVLGQASGSTVLLSKIDGLGNLLWEGSYSNNVGSTAKFIAGASDGGYVLIGTSQNHVVLTKLTPTASALPIELPPAIPHAVANATILQQVHLSGISATSAIQTTDGGYAVVAQVSNVEGEAYSVLLKTDSELNTQWSTPIRLEADTSMTMIVQTKDGGYAVVGEKGTHAGWHMQLALVKFSSSGQLQWNQTYPLSASSNMYNFVEGFIETSDGGFLFAATTSYSDTGAPYVVRTDIEGNSIWAKSLTINSSIPLWGIAVSSLVQTTDGDFSIIGFDRPHSAMSSSYFKIIHLDADGNTLWIQSFGNQDGNFHSYVSDGILTSDGGYLLVGSYTSSQEYGTVLLVKVDSNGEMVWFKSFDNQAFNSAGSVCQTGDGGYIFSAFTDRFPCIIQVSALGDIKDMVTLDSLFGGYAGQTVTDLNGNSDGFIMFAGQYTGLNNMVYNDIWLAKITMDSSDSTTTPVSTQQPNSSLTPSLTEEQTTPIPSLPELFLPLTAVGACFVVVLAVLASRKLRKPVAQP